jgi:hypothetical protein
VLAPPDPVLVRPSVAVRDAWSRPRKTQCATVVPILLVVRVCLFFSSLIKKQEFNHKKQRIIMWLGKTSSSSAKTRSTPIQFDPVDGGACLSVKAWPSCHYFIFNRFIKADSIGLVAPCH